MRTKVFREKKPASDERLLAEKLEYLKRYEKKNGKRIKRYNKIQQKNMRFP